MVEKILSEVTIPGVTGFGLDIPNPGGLFGGGLLSGIGTILQLVFGVTLAVWVVLSLVAGFKIIQSQGNPDQIKEGMTRLKYLWISVSVFFGFFIVISIVGVIVGYGSPVEWGNTLAQCGGYDGPFYFSQIDQQSSYYFTKFNVKVGTGQKGYCCKYTEKNNSYMNTESSPLGFVSNLGINNDGYNWYLPLPEGDTGYKTAVDANGNVGLTLPSGPYSTGTGLTECVEYGK